MPSLISRFTLVGLLAVGMVASGAHATNLIPQCDPPTIPTIHPDGSYDCVMPDGSQPPPELGGPPPAPDPGPAPAPAPSPTDPVAYWTNEITDVTPTWQYLSASQGCRTVVVTHTAHSFFYNTLFRHNLRVYWCWARNAVLRASTQCYASDVDPLIVVDGCTSSGHNYFFNNNPNGGFDAISTGNYHNCIIIQGGLCPFNYNVNVELFAHGDGSYNANGGSPS